MITTMFFNGSKIMTLCYLMSKNIVLLFLNRFLLVFNSFLSYNRWSVVYGRVYSIFQIKVRYYERRKSHRRGGLYTTKVV